MGTYRAFSNANAEIAATKKIPDVGKNILAEIVEKTVKKRNLHAMGAIGASTIIGYFLYKMNVFDFFEMDDYYQRNQKKHLDSQA